MQCAEFDVELPGNFPYAEWKAFFQSSTSYPLNSPEFGDFVRSMQASAYQFRMASDAVNSMISDWIASDGRLDSEGKYRQQRDLSLFVGASITSIESAGYACYVTLTQKRPARFPWSDVKQRKAYFYSVLPALLDQSYGPGLALCATFRAMTASPEWGALQDLRNTFVHRTLPSRLHEGVSGPATPPNEMVKYASTWSHIELRETEAQTNAKLDWVAAQLRSVFSGAMQL